MTTQMTKERTALLKKIAEHKHFAQYIGGRPVAYELEHIDTESSPPRIVHKSYASERGRKNSCCVTSISLTAPVFTKVGFDKWKSMTKDSKMEILRAAREGLSVDPITLAFQRSEIPVPSEIAETPTQTQLDPNVILVLSVEFARLRKDFDQLAREVRSRRQPRVQVDSRRFQREGLEQEGHYSLLDLADQAEKYYAEGFGQNNERLTEIFKEYNSVGITISQINSFFARFVSDCKSVIAERSNAALV